MPAKLAVAALAAMAARGLTRWRAPPPPANEALKPAPVAGPDFPRPPGDPAAVARGKQIYSVNCAFCHGSTARGGEGGPNLLRSPIVLNDQKGELVAAIVSTG